jgi:hypothetical protein
MSINNAVPSLNAGGGLPASASATDRVSRDAATTAVTNVGVGICKCCHNLNAGPDGVKESVKKLQADGFTPLGLPILRTRSLCGFRLHWAMLGPIFFAMFILTVLARNDYAYDTKRGTGRLAGLILWS